MKSRFWAKVLIMLTWPVGVVGIIVYTLLAMIGIAKGKREFRIRQTIAFIIPWASLILWAGCGLLIWKWLN